MICSSTCFVPLVNLYLFGSDGMFPEIYIYVYVQNSVLFYSTVYVYILCELCVALYIVGKRMYVTVCHLGVYV